MMASAGPPSGSSFLPLLESLEDSTTGQSEQTDAYLTIANRLSGEEGRQFLPAVEKHFSRLGKTSLVHINSQNPELSQAALQALGFCVYHSHVVSGLSETLAAEILSALCALVIKSTDKNTCTRALWVISKQSFPPDVVAKKVSSMLGTLESVWSREDIQSVVMEHEALNVIIRMLEQAPAQMGEGAVRWARLIIPLVVHSASKVRLRAAAALEMGMPFLLEKQTEVAAIIEPMMSSKLIPELQKLFMSKNETNVLKLWPLFVKLLGKLLHRGGPFINSLLHLEELGFRSSSPTIKKIAFIAWKSLIDNFALNPDILCSSKRMKLLMQPLASIHVRTEALLLTKVEVWWYLVVQLGPNLSPNFDQVSVPLLACTIGSDCPSVPGTPSRAVSQNCSVAPGTPKTAGPAGFNSPANTPRMSLNSSVQIPSTFLSIQLLGLEMLLHYFLGPEVIDLAAKNKLILSLEPLNHLLLSGASSFTKHAAVLTSNIREGFINVGKEAPDALLALIWTSLVRFVNLTVESVGSKKDRQGCEVLTSMLQALQSIVSSENLPANKVLSLLEATVKVLPQRVLGSASYQVGKMDVLNGTPALFLIQLLYNSSMLPAYIEDERFFNCLQTLVGCGLSGHTSPLAFAEAVLGAIRRSAASVQNKEQLWRMWSVMVSPLTDTIIQSNEVNQGDALEHNFSAMHSALMFPIKHLLGGSALQQSSQKSMLSSWSKLYKVFARCSALVVTAEENICCEELCAKMTTAIDKDALMVPLTLNAVASILQVMVEYVDFSPYTPQFQQKLKSPHTPVNWMKKRNKVMGNLSTFQSLLVQCLDAYLEDLASPSEATGLALLSILSSLFTNLALANTVSAALTALIGPLALFYKQAASEPPRFSSQMLGKLEKLLSDVLGCLQTRSTLSYDDDLLALLSPLLCVLFPHKNKQLRSAITQFWNATFANSVSLNYPEEIRPILSQVKQKTPIILPGFELVSVSDEFSGPYSSESSQMETKLSGVSVSSVGKRDSLLGKAAEMKERSSTMASKPVSTRLDFGSPKPPRREVLEEEASIDFVFIPPETKQRVLTEHQKEVKRTKRVDIPAMYNNLDASLDTTVFTQYTQSQEDSLDKLPGGQAEKVTPEAPEKVHDEEPQIEGNTEVLIKDSQDYTSPEDTEKKTENLQEEMVPESADVSMEDVSKSDDKAEDSEMQSKEGNSPNMSGSSDLVSGTPQKPNSRRQSFITLEKYAEGKAASPSSASTFTGPLIKTSNSQEGSKTKRSSSQALQTSTDPRAQDSQSSQAGQHDSQSPANNESPVRPKDSVTKCEPVRLTDRLTSDTTEDEDVIPDTQTQVEDKDKSRMTSTFEDIETSSQAEESEQSLNDSQSSGTETTLSEPRRSGRHRVRPLLPGEDPEERDEKFTQVKRKRSEGEPKGDSPKSSSDHSRPNTRGKMAAEEQSGKDRLRTRSQRDRNESSQTSSQGRPTKKIKLYSSSEVFLDQPEPRRRSTRDRESSQTDSQSNTESEGQSQGRLSRCRRSSLEVKEEAKIKKKVLPDTEASQTPSEEPELPQNAAEEPKTDSQMITTAPITSSRSQEFDPKDQTEEDCESQRAGSSPTKESHDEISSKDEVTNECQIKGDPGQVDSQSFSQSSSKGQTLRKSRRSKVSSESTSQSQESETEEAKKKKEIPEMSVPSQTNDSQDTTRRINEPVTFSEVKTKGPDDNLRQEGPHVAPPSSSDSQTLRTSRRSKTSSDLQAGDQSQMSHLPQKAVHEKDSQIDASVATSESQDRSSSTNKSVEEPVAADKTKKREDVDENSQMFTPASSNSKPLRKSRRSKTTSDSQIGSQSKESQLLEKTNHEKDSQVDVSVHKQPQDQTRLTNKSVEETEVGDKTNMREDDENSQMTTPASSDSQPLRKSRRSKVAEPEDKNENKDSSRRQSRSSSQVMSEGLVKADSRVGGRTRRSKAQEEQSKSSPSSTLETSQSMDPAESQESSQGKGRYSRRRSSQALVESSGSESSEAKESPVMPQKRGKRSRTALQSSLTLEPKEDKTEDEITNSESSQEVDSQSLDAKNSTNLEDSRTDLQVSVSPQVPLNTEEQGDEESPMEVEEAAVERAATEVPDPGDLQSDDLLKPLEVIAEQIQEQLPSVLNAEDTLAPPVEEAEKLQEEKKTEVAEPCETAEEPNNSDLNHQEQSAITGEDEAEDQNTSLEPECLDVSQELLKEQRQSRAGENITAVQDTVNDSKTQIMDSEVTAEAQNINTEDDPSTTEVNALLNVENPSVTSESTRNLESNEKLQGSPAKTKDLETIMGKDVGQSPNSGRTRGSWSPSASPSTSILKKGQKRPVEDETPSPLVKSRRVSFANPIQHQEMADDIDRRSPALRTSSPRRSRVSNIPAPKYITTPTKGMLVLSPRNLHSPGYKSSKKCLISEMSQEPRPVSKDCIFPPLVGCSAPVEAVLPQISSNMWSRGFGQLVRARNIKTVGDLSALTPSEIKTLPIRSPKISNVKKALKNYEQQRKGRGGDDLKSFDETEMMTSELEETNTPLNQEEDYKSSAEMLATELVDEPVPFPDIKNDVSTTFTPETPSDEGILPAEVEALSHRMTPEDLHQCSPQQLVQIHDHLGGMMRRVVVELQTRLCQKDEKP